VRKRLRILMLLENCPFPRDERVRREAKVLVSAGHSVSVIAPLAPGECRKEEVGRVHVYRYRAPGAGMGFMGYVWEHGYSTVAIFIVTLRVLLDEGFDVLHAHHPPDTLALIGMFYKLLGKRYVLDHHDLAPELYNARFRGKGNWIVYQVLVVLERFACRMADHVVTTNESYRRVEVQRDKVPEHTVTVVRNAPDLDELQTTEGGLDLGQEEKSVIGYVGVTGTQDGVDYLLRAVNRLVLDLGRIDLACIVVGSGDALPRLKALSEQLRISNYVVFTGWVESPSEVARYLEAMDICVAPEPSDPYNNRSTASKLMEYMAFGKPIVAFDLPEHRYTAGEAALYARPNDELDFAKKIAFLMDDARARQRMGQMGRERIETDLGWAQQRKNLVELYEKLV
jgi:glycosyltransferase involved in cell wall biosynthesis